MPLESSAFAALMAGLILALWYGLYLTHQPVSALRSGTKTGATLLLALFAYLIGVPDLVLAGLLLGALGDLFLSRPKEQGFLPGLAAFLVGHTLYLVWAIGQIGAFENVLISPIRAALVAALIIAAVVLTGRLLPRLGTLMVPVLLYVGISLALGAAALMGAGAVFVTGALLFITSDMILAVQLFLMEPDSKRNRAASTALWLLYWGGQSGIVLGTSILAQG